ncbi:MAG TPA: MGMT family protein [Dermatophilaceae bacterium]|mgnify:CR=1 FL=1|nr:MGMT family protein [Dermatophilaceae bacterium]
MPSLASGSGRADHAMEYAERVLALVRQIPEGQVATYGDLAGLVGSGGPRQVGQVMSRYGSDVPWWRVIRAGGLPPQCHAESALEHYRAEGTPLRGTPPDYRVDLRRARWAPVGAASVEGGAASAAAGESRVAGERAAYRGGVHHVEIWVADLDAARRSWGWLLGELGWRLGDDWGHGFAYEIGPVYLVVEAGPDVLAGGHERRRAGVNHLAFHAGSREQVDELVVAASAHGWSLLFGDRHPFAGGPEHYAAYLEDDQGFEVELVAGT